MSKQTGGQGVSNNLTDDNGRRRARLRVAAHCNCGLLRRWTVNGRHGCAVEESSEGGEKRRSTSQAGVINGRGRGEAGERARGRRCGDAGSWKQARGAAHASDCRLSDSSMCIAALVCALAAWL